MIRALKQYIWQEASPRWRKIILTWESAISLAVVILFVWFGDRWFVLHPKTSDITTGLIAYAAIALGFCVAGLTISLTFPQAEFTSELAKPSTEACSYSDLLFVFSWTAIAHWCAIMILFVAILLTDGSQSLLPVGHSGLRLWGVALIAGFGVYCLCQFLITLITLSQVGDVYIRFLRRKG
ncbi:MAG TPA: hypothetical protein VLV89_00225 [Candidatus Acidoferrum sp.]|nr:hypothetical protein [Candidatus Acidoferrum sp.]